MFRCCCCCCSHCALLLSCPGCNSHREAETKAGAEAGAEAGAVSEADAEAGLHYKIIDMPTCCCSLGLGLGLESMVLDESETCSLLCCQSIVCENFAMKLHSFAPDQHS